MKSPILLLAFTLFAFFSCTTAYKSGQTPDDLYYAAPKPQPEYEDQDEDKRTSKEEYRYNDETYDDRYLRMKVRNRYRWSELNDWYYNDQYSYNYNYYYGGYNNPFNSWNYFYNPYCCCHSHYGYVSIPSKIPFTPPVTRRHFSLGGYTNTVTNNYSGTTNRPPIRNSATKPAYNNSNGLGERIKSILDNDNSGSRSTRTYTPSTSSGSSGNNNSSSSSGSSGSSGNSNNSSGSGTISRPVRN